MKLLIGIIVCSLILIFLIYMAYKEYKYQQQPLGDETVPTPDYGTLYWWIGGIVGVLILIAVMGFLFARKMKESEAKLMAK